MNSPHLLLVGISGEDRAVLEQVLGSEFALNAADTPEAALELVPVPGIDLIIVEGGGREMHPENACGTLLAAARTAEIPVLLLVDGTEAGGELIGRCPDFADFLRRPLIPVVTLRRVANQLELRRLRRQVGSLSSGNTEAVDGVAFDALCAREWSRSVRAGSFLSLIVLSLTRSDSGRQGRVPFADVAELTCREVVQRKTDVVARIGSNEVGCLLPETDLEGAFGVAWRIREALEHHIGTVEGSGTLLEGIGIGVGSILPHKDNTMTMLRRAAEAHSRRAAGIDESVVGDYVL